MSRLSGSRVGVFVSLVSAIYAATASQCVASEAAEGSPQTNSDRLVIHEWGTFTSLQDESGNAIGGINGDDEPVPEFVHRISKFLILGPGASIPILYQGAPRCHPDVTLRLETPVVYFYPAKSAKLPLKLDVDVAFPSGWLSEYYPGADVEAPGVKGEMSFGAIRNDAIGRVKWKDLDVGTDAEGPKTSSGVWLAPRAVQSVALTTRAGESERFLFYRGVGHVDSPIRVSRGIASRDLSRWYLAASANFPAVTQRPAATCAVRKLWVVEVRDKNLCAFSERNGFEVPADGKEHSIGLIPETFKDSEFNPGNLAELCASVRAALIEDGLFADEADALLNTWKLSYFQSPGLRLFYLLPRSWTDHALPLQTSDDADIVRVMVGRVELVTPKQRQLLQQIAAGPASKPERWNATSQPVAEDFLAYEQLGRFRNALILDELKRRPTPALEAFVRNYGLQGYQLVNVDETQ